MAQKIITIADILLKETSIAINDGVISMRVRYALVDNTVPKSLEISEKIDIIPNDELTTELPDIQKVLDFVKSVVKTREKF